MNIHIQLFGALREASTEDGIDLDVPADTIGGVREALLAHLATHAPQVRASLVRRSAFASDEEILRDDAPLPADGALALLPPVSGG